MNEGKQTMEGIENHSVVTYVEKNEELVIDLMEVFRILKSKVLLVGCVGLICAVLMIVWVLTLMPRAYEATEKLYVSGGSSSILDLSALQIGSSLSTDYQEVFRNKEIHEQVRQRLFLEYTDTELDSMISITNPTGRILVIKIKSLVSEYEAKRMVEEYCEAARLFIEERMGGKMPSVFETATILEWRRGLAVKTIIAFIVGLFLAAMSVLAVHYLVDRLENRQQIETWEMAFLGAIGNAKTKA